MIAYLKGRVLSKEPSSVVIETGGVGYNVEVPLSTYYELGDAGSEAELLIHTHVREDAFLLYGFNTAGERSLFRRLIGISGVGPKLALAIIGGMGSSEFLGSVEVGDIGRIVQIPGVGKKTAERLIVELKDKMTELKSELQVELDVTVVQPSSIQLDVISALENLGYKRSVADKAARSALTELGEDCTFEELLKRTLANLTG